MIKTLVTRAMPFSEMQYQKLSELGLEIVHHTDERSPVKRPEQYELVMCNGLFLYQEIREFENLRFVQLSSAGLDRVPTDYIREKGILLKNAGDTYSVPMAEFAVGGILQLYKKTSFFIRNKKDRRWSKNRDLRELPGKTVLVLGTGNVGREISKRLTSFGCNVIGCSRTQKENAAFSEILPMNRLDEFLPQTDILVLALPLTEKTTELINERRLSLLKSDATVVNVARGRLIDEKALIRWLQTHPEGGAVLDVFEEEPLSEDNDLWIMDNVILTPHNSFVGEGNLDRLFQIVLENTKDYLAHRDLM